MKVLSHEKIGDIHLIQTVKLNVEVFVVIFPTGEYTTRMSRFGAMQAINNYTWRKPR